MASVQEREMNVAKFGCAFQGIFGTTVCSVWVRCAMCLFLGTFGSRCWSLLPSPSSRARAEGTHREPSDGDEEEDKEED